MKHRAKIRDIHFHPMEEEVPSEIKFTVWNSHVGNETIIYKDSLDALMRKFNITTEDGFNYVVPDFRGKECYLNDTGRGYEFGGFVDE